MLSPSFEDRSAGSVEKHLVGRGRQVRVAEGAIVPLALNRVAVAKRDMSLWPMEVYDTDDNERG